MFQPNKKFNLNEGREITDGALIYGGFPRILNEAKKAKKDYDKDGKLETSEEEWRGSVDRAIKAKMGKKVEESFDATDFEIVEDLLEELFDENELDLIIEAAEKKKWIQKAIKKEGSLRKTLKVKKGETIPEKKLEAAAKKGGKTGKRARLAMTLKKLNESSEQNNRKEYEALVDRAYGLQSAINKKGPGGRTEEAIEELKKAFDAFKNHPYHKIASSESEKTENLMRGGSTRKPGRLGVD